MFRYSKKSSPAGKLGGACKPANIQMGVPLPYCNSPLVCGYDGIGKRVCKAPAPGYKPGSPGKPAPAGTLGMPCIPGGAMSDGLCKNGLVCVKGVPSPVCMPPGPPAPGPPAPGPPAPGPSGPSPPTKSGMGSKEILTIIGLIFLGLCFLCGLAKMGMKDAKRKGNCDKACGAFVFLGVALIAVSSVLKSSGSSGSTATGLIPAGEEGGPCKQLSDKLRICGPGLFCNNQNRCQKLPYVPGILPAPSPGPGKKQPGSYGMPCTNPPIIVDPRNPAKKLRCQPGLECKRSSPDVMPICMPSGL